MEHYLLCHCECPWRVWREYHHVQSHYPARRAPLTKPTFVATTWPLIPFQDTLHGIPIPAEQWGRPEQPRYIIWDNMTFRRAALVCNWFSHTQFIFLYFPPYSLFQNPSEEIFVFGMLMESEWLPSPHTHASSLVNGKCMWSSWCEGLRWFYLSLQKILSPLISQG